MIKKYFILLIIILPLIQIIPALFMVLGPRYFIDFYSSPEIFILNFENTLINIERVTSVTLRSLLGLAVFLDLKQDWKLIALPFFTILSPIAGVTLFIIRYYFVNQKTEAYADYRI
jgi:hypothetical protein